MTPDRAGGWGGVGQATKRQCMAGQGWGICVVRVFSICLAGVGWEWGRGRIGYVRIGYDRVVHMFR